MCCNYIGMTLIQDIITKYQQGTDIMWQANQNILKTLYRITFRLHVGSIYEIINEVHT